LLLSKIRLPLHYHTNNIIDIQNIIKMTKLQLILLDPNNVIRTSITTRTLDMILTIKSKQYLENNCTAPFTSVDFRTANQAALKMMVQDGTI